MEEHDLFPLVVLGLLDGNRLILPCGEELIVYPYGIISDQFDGKYAYYQLDEKNIINNAVLYE